MMSTVRAIASGKDIVISSANEAGGFDGQMPVRQVRLLIGSMLLVFATAVEWTQCVSDLDRVELCRPLTVDPKVARRERFRQQGARGTGLFAKRRKGGKAGY